MVSSATPEIINVSVVGNVARGQGACGGGIAARVSAAGLLDHVIVYDNEVDENAWIGGICDQDGLSIVKYCNVYDNEGAEYYGADLTGTMGNISVDPEFLDTSPAYALDWDLHIDTTSGCVNAGDLTISDPDAARSDIGAYGGPGAEYYDLDLDGYFEWWQPGAYDYGNYPALGWDCDDQEETTYPGNGC